MEIREELEQARTLIKSALAKLAEAQSQASDGVPSGLPDNQVKKLLCDTTVASKALKDCLLLLDGRNEAKIEDLTELDELWLSARHKINAFQEDSPERASVKLTIAVGRLTLGPQLI